MTIFANLFRADILSQLGDWGIAYGLVLVRILGFIHSAPVFSHKSVNGTARIGFAILFSLVLTDFIGAEAPPEQGYFYPFAIVFNTALGMLIGYVANLMFSAVVAGGEMMDSSMGFSSGQMFDPATGHQTTIIGRFMGMLATVVFFNVSGPQMLMEGLANSFNSMSIYSDHINIDIARIISLVGDVITMGFIMVSPVVLTILVTDLVLGLVSRAAPQINAFQISFTIKPSIGNIVFVMILPLFFSALIGFLTSPSRFF